MKKKTSSKKATVSSEKTKPIETPPAGGELHLVINPFGDLNSSTTFDIPPQGIPEHYDQGELDANSRLDRLANLIEETDKKLTKDLEEQAVALQQSETLAQQIQDAVDQAYDRANNQAPGEGDTHSSPLSSANTNTENSALSEDGPAYGWSASESDLNEIQSSIEALLFLADRPLVFNRIDDALLPEFQSDLQLTDQNEARRNFLKLAIERLMARYNEPCSGVELVEVAGGYQLRTKIQRASLFKRLAKVTTQRLSRGAMETLAIVAYRQPVMKEDVDQVRGVDCSHFIRTLLERKLIQISGRSELPGRPILYTTSDEFLQIFGLSSLQQLPPLSEIEQLIPQSEIEKRNEDPRVVQMRKLVAQMQEASKNDGLGYSAKEDEAILAEIKEKIQAIPTTTETLRQQADAEKQARQATSFLAEPPQPEAQAKADVTADVPQPGEPKAESTPETNAPGL